MSLIDDALKTQTPKDFVFTNGFWTTPMLAYLIKEQFGVDYKSKTSIYLLFKKARLSFHKPGQVYKNRNQEVVDEWLKNTLLIIEEALKDPDTAVIVSDEMILKSHIWLSKS